MNVNPWLRVPIALSCVLCLSAQCLQQIGPVLGRVLDVAATNFGAPYRQLLGGLLGTIRLEPADDTASAPMTLEVALLRQLDRDGEVVAEAIRNGDVLHWRGSPEDSDRFKVFFRPSDDCYVYVVNIDSTGWANVLHPEDGVGKPTRAGTENFSPASDDAWAVDGYRGIETMYFVASRQRRLDIEEALQPFVGRERPDPPAGVTITEPGDQIFDFAERIGGAEALLPIAATTVLFDTQAFKEIAGKNLVVTRWFRHE